VYSLQVPLAQQSVCSTTRTAVCSQHAPLAKQSASTTRTAVCSQQAPLAQQSARTTRTAVRKHHSYSSVQSAGTNRRAVCRYPSHNSLQGPLVSAMCSHRVSTSSECFSGQAPMPWNHGVSCEVQTESLYISLVRCRLQRFAFGWYASLSR
jgi:hypothetical protein